MTAKTHKTAVVLIPPEEVWEPIQAIRRQHDRQVRRWMPHVTLLYPFLPRESFDEVGQKLSVACRAIEPFATRLAEFRHFDHGRGRNTLWLAPEPKDAFVRLQAALESAVPECSDVSQHPDGFTPHLSVGQVRGYDNTMTLKTELQRDWSAGGGLSFVADRISLIWRGSPPDDVFQIDRQIRLGP
jgi:2'-5' RNA ligase